MADLSDATVLAAVLRLLVPLAILPYPLPAIDITRFSGDAVSGP